MEKSEFAQSALKLIKGILIAVTVTLLFLVIFALFVQFLDVGENVIKPVNQVIKVLSIGIGCFFGMGGKNGILKGFLLGFSVIMINYLVFSIMAASWTFNWWTVLDIMFGTLVGGICGAITVNIKKPKN